MYESSYKGLNLCDIYAEAQIMGKASVSNTSVLLSVCLSVCPVCTFLFNTLAGAAYPVDISCSVLIKN